MDIGIGSIEAIRAAETALASFLADRGLRALALLRGSGGHNKLARRWVVTFDYDLDARGLERILATATESNQGAEARRIASRIQELDSAQKKGAVMGGAPGAPPLAMVWVDDHTREGVVVEFQGMWLGPSAGSK